MPVTTALCRLAIGGSLGLAGSQVASDLHRDQVSRRMVDSGRARHLALHTDFLGKDKLGVFRQQHLSGPAVS